VGIREYFLLAVLGVWLILSLLRQTQKTKAGWIRRLDPLGLVPSWRFFGPNPTTWDFGLYLRSRNGHEPWSSWADITPCSRGKMAFLWNPLRRPRKVFFSACRQVFACPKENLRKTSGYKLILAYAVTRPLGHTANCRQFEITRCRALVDREGRETLFRSEEYIYSIADSA
jgi:hypothetical protein